MYGIVCLGMFSSNSFSLNDNSCVSLVILLKRMVLISTALLENALLMSLHLSLMNLGKRCTLFSLLVST
jgi:hypothetical protein